MAKGGAYENEIAKLLSGWWHPGRDDIFGRSDASGARFTQRKKSGKDTANQGGDLTFIDSVGEPLIKSWNIECKTGYSQKEAIRDADGDVIQYPVYIRGKKGEEKIIKRWEPHYIIHQWDILDHLDLNQNKTVLETFWEQCCRDANSTNRVPILIFRRNRRKTCICFSMEYYNHLSDYFGDCPYDLIMFQKHLGIELVIISLKDFFEWVPAESMKVMLNDQI